MEPSLPKNITVWGLTGGIGSGKSLAAQYFEEAGIPTINLDLLGKEILDRDLEVHEKLKVIFGRHVITDSGVNRQAMREIVFRDKTKREQLENILHPKIWKLFADRAEAKGSQGKKIVLCEAALFIEHNHAKLFPRLIVVLANEEIRRKRFLSRDKMPVALFEEILKTQTDDSTRKKVATDIITNEGTENQLKSSIQSLVGGWKAKGLI